MATSKKQFLRAALAAAMAAAFLTGCVTTEPVVRDTGPQLPARFNDGTYGFMLSAVPRISGSKPLPAVTTLEAFSGDGVWYFNETNGKGEESHFQVGKNDGKGNYPVKEKYPRGQKAHGFAWGTNVSSVIRQGKHYPADTAYKITEGVDGSVYLHSGTESDPFVMRLKLYAFDVSGQQIYRYLRKSDNYPTNVAYYSSGIFPAGSIAYMPQISLQRDSFVVKNKDAFTGAKNIGDFVMRFRQDVPFCLSYLPRQGFRAYGVSFAGSDIPAVIQTNTVYGNVKKTRTIKNKNGKLVKQTYTERVPVRVESNLPKTGKVSLLPVKTGTVFCQKTSDTPEVNGTYEVKLVDGTRGMVFEFKGGKVKAPDIGIFELSRGTVSAAVVEMARGKTTAAIPGYFVKAGIPITDFQYRFNKVAADAVRKELAKKSPI